MRKIIMTLCPAVIILLMSGINVQASNHTESYVVKIKNDSLIVVTRHNHHKNTDTVKTVWHVVTPESTWHKKKTEAVVTAGDLSIQDASTLQAKQQKLHGAVDELYSKSFIDSMRITYIHLNDSIRTEMAKFQSAKDILFLSLTNGLKDSTLLANLDKLASPAPPAPKQYTGTLVPHVSDASQHTSLDSAIVKVYHGNKLTATGVTAITGSCTISGLQPGEYLVSFNRRSFAPFSLMQVKVSAAGFSYIEVPMTKIKAPFFFIGENYRIWEYAGIGLAVLFLFAYFVSLFFWRHKMPPMPRAAV